MIGKKSIEEITKEMSIKFNELKKCQESSIQKNIIFHLKNLAKQAFELLDLQYVSANNIRKRNQINQILKKCDQTQLKLRKQQQKKRNCLQQLQLESITQQLDQKKRQPTQQQLARMSRNILRSIVQYQLDSKQLKYSPQEIDQIANRYQKVDGVMNDMKEMIVEQGYDIDQLEHNLSITYNNTQAANKLLDQAFIIKNQTRLMKIKLGFSGVLAAFGLKIIGLPGLIAGFITGMIITK